jgi:hypothetical protein
MLSRGGSSMVILSTQSSLILKNSRMASSSRLLKMLTKYYDLLLVARMPLLAILISHRIAQLVFNTVCCLPSSEHKCIVDEHCVGCSKAA